MFIVSKKNFKLRYPDGTVYRIARDYMGEIPEHAANHPLVRLAIKDGSIVTPEGKKDKQVEKAAEVAEATAKEYDIRPDAPVKKRTRKKAE